jgi:hypothetical protein
LVRDTSIIFADAADKLLATVAFAAQIRVDDEMSDVAVKVEVAILLAMVAFAPHIRVDDEMSDVAVKVDVFVAPLTSNNTLGAVVPIPTFPLGWIRIRSSPEVVHATVFVAGLNQPVDRSAVNV